MYEFIHEALAAHIAATLGDPPMISMHHMLVALCRRVFINYTPEEIVAWDDTWQRVASHYRDAHPNGDPDTARERWIRTTLARGAVPTEVVYSWYSRLSVVARTDWAPIPIEQQPDHALSPQRLLDDSEFWSRARRWLEQQDWRRRRTCGGRRLLGQFAIAIGLDAVANRVGYHIPLRVPTAARWCVAALHPAHALGQSLRASGPSASTTLTAEQHTARFEYFDRVLSRPPSSATVMSSTTVDVDPDPVVLGADISRIMADAVESEQRALLDQVMFEVQAIVQAADPLQPDQQVALVLAADQWAAVLTVLRAALRGSTKLPSAPQLMHTARRAICVKNNQEDE